MKTNVKPKVVYVLPSYDLDTGSHFFHLYEFLEQAAKGLDLFVVIERCRCSSAAPRFRHYCQRFFWPPLRFFEILFILARCRLCGYKNFYVHYSFEFPLRPRPILVGLNLVFLVPAGYYQ